VNTNTARPARGRGSRWSFTIGATILTLAAGLVSFGCASSAPAPVAAPAPAFELVGSTAATLDACRQHDRACHYFSATVLSLSIADGKVCLPAETPALDEVEAVILSALARDTSDEPAQAASRALAGAWPCPAARYVPATTVLAAKVSR
jgi:hypothetical protein